MTGSFASASPLEPTGYIDLEGVEQASVEVPIADSNIGFRMLQKMGWQSGQGLGRDGQGRVDPIPVVRKADVMGIGRLEEDHAMHEAATAGPRMLESERQAIETEEERIYREAAVEKQRNLQQHLDEVTSVFYCELCDKRYQKVAEWENHLSSYDHNHKKVRDVASADERTR
ncbi:G-patch domain-containing protein [Thamnocephalis sphaerospora]|uniref:G-patch domain-containing protein n=1 Tax=Thamnocephalis sphaerospora TaxID=78915 RepID=A0A4P9XSD6_9FUNG|nr:G-patch domain-containing protein [Thamnocephalis sphaerospora]|eukprot:RKP09028.1 G-patch domain-containing protein [Thamnocephalis sphaerospora]